MKTHRIHLSSGESLVEVMVSAVIFLMMMAVLQGAISFCTNAQHKSREIRERNAEICRNLQTASYIPGPESKNYIFKATTAEGETPGAEAAPLLLWSSPCRWGQSGSSRASSQRPSPPSRRAAPWRRPGKSAFSDR